jgi:ferredoxin
MTTRELFAGMLLDLAALVPPKLTIMDAVTGMEGDGPFNGTPRHIGLLIASSDPLSLDVVVSEIMGLPKEKNPLLVEAGKRNMHPTCIDEVEVIGVPLSQINIPDFKLPASFIKDNTSILNTFLKPLIKKSFTVDPRIIKSKCTACGACKKACPRNAIMINKIAVIDKNKCIRCYCCHEMCQYDAVELHKSFLYKLINRN